MSAIGSLVFCTDCGNLLDGSSGDSKATLVCDACGASCRGVFSCSVLVPRKCARYFLPQLVSPNVPKKFSTVVSMHLTSRACCPTLHLSLLFHFASFTLSCLT